MRITTLVENTSCTEGIAAEHGLSIYIETKGRAVLFDTGASGTFADNAAKLGADLSRVEFAVLSHGHYDHGGGLRRFLEANRTAPVYVSPHAFEGHYKNGGKTDIGLDPALLRETDRIRQAADGEEVAPGMTVHSCSGRLLVCPMDTGGMLAMSGGALFPEDFRHEQYLLVEEDGRRILFSGCSHKGILNIADWFRPDVLVGGFHFMGIPMDDAGKSRLAQAAQALLSYPTAYCTGHCTGAAQYEFLKGLMGGRLRYIAAGSRLEI